jgi:hypothetical protein
MALLGREGILELRRELTPPLILPSSQLSIANNRFTINSDDFWIGDPLKLYGDGTSVVTVLSGFLGRDTIGNASLYSTQAGALNRTASEVISLGGLRSTSILLAHDTNAPQALFLTDYFRRFLYDSSISFSKEYQLSQDVENYEAYKSYGPPYLSWKTQAVLRGWQLNIQTPDINISAIGQRFSESIKSTLSGSGTFDFLVDIYAQPAIDDSTSLLRLALMLEYGAKGNARFYLSPDVSETSPRRSTKGLPSSHKKLYYSAQLLLTNTSVDSSGDGLIAGSADFVTTGPVRLGVDVEQDKTYSYTSSGTELGVFRFYAGHYGNYEDSFNINASIAENGDYYVANPARTPGNQGTTPPLGCSLVKFGRANLNWPNWSKILKVVDDYIYESYGTVVRIDKQGGIWSAFVKKNLTALKYKICVAKLEPTDGSVITSFCITVPVTYESVSLPFFVDMDFDTSGNIYLGTHWRDSNFQFHPCIIKVFSDGVISWVRRLSKTSGNRGDHYLLRIKVTSNEVFIGCKNTRGETFTGTYTRPASFVKLNLDGSTKIGPTAFTAQTDITSITQNDARIQAVDMAPDGSVYALYMASESSFGSGNQQLYVLKATSSLNAAWAYALNHGPSSVEVGANALYPRDVHVDNQGRIFLLGRAINTSFQQLAPCKTWVWSTFAYNWGAGISEIDSDGNYLAVRYYNTSSLTQNAFNERSLLGISSTVRFARTAGNTSSEFLPLSTNDSSATASAFTTTYSQAHVFAKKEGQFGVWGNPCETRTNGDFALTVFGYTPLRSNSLGITRVSPATGILTDNFGIESDASFVISENFSLTTAVFGFSVGD